MYKPVKYKNLILAANGLTRLLGNIVKTLSYPFHFVFPKKRFTIPKFDPARRQSPKKTKINRVIWQTNYSNNVTLPIYCNYLFNRLLSRSYDYRYVSTEERAEYIKANADERTFNAYSKLTDGAAQADFWRIFTLYNEGGVYMDIDGHLVWCLDSIIDEEDDEVVIARRGQYTNFFLASKKGNAFLKETLEIIIDNIEQERISGGVFSLTGPKTLIKALENKDVNSRLDKLTCSQGTFTNEYFQYIDKKRGKWIHAKNEDLLK
ncbi:glycosyltransferase sugar-binding region containing DXD motif family protein [Pasteurella multocida subsp. multocida OH4807]|nr:glycosyltransferase sugar-binding region containing DXD motif family protein [Pasteurella multocida subsp. multocida OH4807]